MVSLFGSGCVAQARREMSLTIAVPRYAEFEKPNENVTPRSSSSRIPTATQSTFLKEDGRYNGCASKLDRSPVC